MCAFPVLGENWKLEMTSLAYSIGIGTCFGNGFSRHNTCVSCLQFKNGDSGPKSSNLQFPIFHQKISVSVISAHPPLVFQNDNNAATITTQLKRREAIGLALGFGLLHALSQPQPTSATEAVPCELTVAPSGLAFCDKFVGTGPEAVKGQLIKAHYVGRLENGKIFDSSYNRGKPLSFRVGVGEVIKGWDVGILGGEGVPPMLAGGKRTLKIPPELGYGARGAGCRGGSCIIPPDSVLLFDVEFIGKS